MSSRHFGHIPGIYEGYHFSTRKEVVVSGIHRPPQAGISGSGKEGADSIVISGGYEDDEDLGDVIIYTGHGGRDLSSGKQVSDQELYRGNLALALNAQTGLPVRVIRGATHTSDYSPSEGYRYDGLYRVTNYWRERGRSGHYVWRFRLEKIKEEAWPGTAEPRVEYETPGRVETLIQRIIRDTALSREVKRMYQYRCQVCRETLETNAGPYAEAAHIQPLGEPHKGPDTLANLLCLCPNHHVLFDYGGFTILDDYELLGIEGRLKVLPRHKIDKEFLQYHRTHFYEETF